MGSAPHQGGVVQATSTRPGGLHGFLCRGGRKRTRGSEAAVAAEETVALPDSVAPGPFCRTRGGTRCTCAPPRCWLASLGWGHTAATGCWSAPQTRRRWGSSCSVGCPGRCHRPRRLGVGRHGRVRARAHTLSARRPRSWTHCWGGTSWTRTARWALYSGSPP